LQTKFQFSFLPELQTALEYKTTTAQKKTKQDNNLLLKRRKKKNDKTKNKKSKSVVIFFVPVGSYYWIYLRLFAMLSSGKTKICQKDFILPSAIFYCVQFHTPKLHTYIQLE